MTTSTLMTHTRWGLSDFDLQVLRDYALQAPWEWRVAFDELIDAAEKEGRAEKLEANLDDARGVMKTVASGLEDAVAGFLKTDPKQLEAAANDLIKEIEETIATLRAEAAPPPPVVHKVETVVQLTKEHKV